MPATVEDLAFELSRAAIARQERRLTDLRSRASTILAAASIGGSFLVGRAATRARLDAFRIAAVLAYLACVATALYVLLPRPLAMEFQGSAALASATWPPGDLPSLQRHAVKWLDGIHERNRAVLDGLDRACGAACVALGTEVALWSAVYADSIF